MSLPCIILPDVDLPELLEFYCNTVTSAVISEDEFLVSSHKGLTVEAKGQQLLQFLLSAAKRVFADLFIISIEDGGVEIPVIASREAYVAAHLAQDQDQLDSLRGSFRMREKHTTLAQCVYQDSMELVESFEAQLADLEQPEELDGSATSDQKDAYKEAEARFFKESSRLETLLETANVAAERNYVTWMGHHSVLLKDKQRAKDLESAAVRGGSDQHTRDTAARGRLMNALENLKSFLSSMLRKYNEPLLFEVVRAMRGQSVDPYYASDMRGCYANLVQSFRKGDEMCVTTTIIGGMKLTQQDSQSLRAFFRVAGEEFMQRLMRMNIHSIRVSDLAAMIVIGGMAKKHQVDFLKSDSQLSLTLDMIAEDLDESGDTSSVVTRKAPKTLFGKLRDFVRQDTELGAISSRLSLLGGSQRETPSLAAGQTASIRDAQKRAKEAQQVLSALEAAAGGKPAICLAFQKFGRCKFGVRCKYEHPATTKPPSRTHVCFSWRDTGSCPQGAACRYAESHVEKGGSASKQQTDSNAIISASAAVGTAQKPVHVKPVGKAVSALMTKSSGLELYYNEDSEDDEVSCVRVCTPVASGVSNAVCLSAETVAAVNSQSSAVLCWDSGSSIHVARDRALLDGGGRPVRKQRDAVGVGGAKPITHCGHSAVFNGLEMSFIKGGGTPNLMSVGRALQVDESGMPGLALFSNSGAVRLRVTPELFGRFMALVEEAESQDLVEGTAVMRNFVFEETFGAVTSSLATPADESGDEQSCPVRVNMFANRIRLDDIDNAIAFMSVSGMSEAALIAGVKGNILGMPPSLTLDRIKFYFENIGKEPAQLAADIVAAPLRIPLDYERDEVSGPGSVLQIDNVDPSFSRLRQLEQDDESVRVGVKIKPSKKVVPSIGGFKDAVVGLDVCTGFVYIEGRESKKNPHHVVRRFVGRWVRQWHNLHFVKSDKEFVTPESVIIIEEAGAKVRQSVPGDHRRNTGQVEGALRWLQDLAQANMNQLIPLVKRGVITEEVSRSLWFHALKHAVVAFNLRPSLCNPSKTRYEEGFGEVANLSRIVLMPFGMSLMGKKLRNDGDGRGSACLYIGPSMTVPGGIITLNLETYRVACKYSFLPIVDVVRTGRAKAHAAVARSTFGRLGAALPSVERIFGEQSAADSVQPVASELASLLSSSEQVVVDTPCMVESPVEDAVSSPVGEHVVPVVPAVVPAVVPIVGAESGGGFQSSEQQSLVVPPVVQKIKKSVVISEYNTRRRGAVPVSASSERPPKPVVPSNAACANNPRWIAADLRESGKLNAEDTFLPLQRDDQGRFVRPMNAIILRLLRVREFKWKSDPETKDMTWLECCRFVCDGSKDKRPDNYYAECPDRMLLFLLESIGATLGEESSQSDCERAYLNALSIDRNIVIIAPSDMHGVPRESLLNKGLYGSRGGALSWERWINEKMASFGYSRADVARGVYLKRLESGELVRSLRHSDDFRVSSKDTAGLVAEQNLMRQNVRMSEFASCERFLGCTMERVNAETGLPDKCGTIVLVRQVDKISEMDVKFDYLREIMNPKCKKRIHPLPAAAIKSDEELDPVNVRLLDSNEIGTYQSLVGCIGWIAGSSRPECKFGFFVLSIRLSAPRFWDLFLGVYVMDYMVGTIQAPLVLGGPVCDPEVFADASYALLNERRSVVGHFVRTGPNSGAIYAHVGSTKCSVTSIFEAELIAANEAIDSALYVTQVCEELEYLVNSCRNVWVDNEAEVAWIRGSVSNKRSRHIDTKMYKARHMDEEGRVRVQHIAGAENPADIFTKPLVGPLFVKHATTVLGHELIRGLGVTGSFC